MKNETNNETETGLVAVTDNSLVGVEMDNDFVPQNREQFELIRELQESAAALDGLEMPKITSKELAETGEVFDIVDAYTTTIEDKKTNSPKRLVVFLIESVNRELTAVMKDGNSVNLQYAEFFSKFKAIGKPQRKTGFQFVEATWLQENAGNYPIILRKAAKVVKSVNK